jgi:hypothetical protein
MDPGKSPRADETELQFGGDCNRKAVRLSLAEIQKEHGALAIDMLSGGGVRAQTWDLFSQGNPLT